MDTSTGQSWVGFVVFSAGMYIIHDKPPAWDVVLLGSGTWIIGIGLIAQNQIARHIENVAWHRKDDKPSTPPAPVEVQRTMRTGGNTEVEVPLAPGYMPLRKLHPDMLDHQYSTDSEFPKIANEKMVARTIIEQRNHNFEINLTEEYWVKGGRFPESREKFAAMMRRWRYHGVIVKKSSARNSTFIVADWQKLRGIASGRTLTAPPNDYKP